MHCNLRLLKPRQPYSEVWPLTTYPCQNYSVFLMLIRYVTLWPWPLTLWPWKFVVHQASRDQSLYKIWAQIGWIIDNFVITINSDKEQMWPIDLGLIGYNLEMVWDIGCKLVLINNRKSHAGLLVPNRWLDQRTRRLLCVITLNALF